MTSHNHHKYSPLEIVSLNRLRIISMVSGVAVLVSAGGVVITSINGYPQQQSHSKVPTACKILSTKETTERHEFKITCPIDNIQELQSHFDLNPTGTLDDRTTAHINALQEICYYVFKWEDVRLTGWPSRGVYEAAEWLAHHPQAQEKLLLGYTYVNRNVYGYEVKIPQVALDAVKKRLGRKRTIEEALDYQDPIIRRIAKDVVSGVEDETLKARLLLRFTRSLSYNYDLYDDYPKHPLETLADGGGDCEDSSILYASLAAAVGIDSAVITIPYHALGGVNLHEDLPNNSLMWDNGRYFLAETTSAGKGYRLGDIPVEYRGCEVKEVISVKAK